jgi:hypothetical protein
MECRACKRLAAKIKRPEWFLTEDLMAHTCSQPERLNPETQCVHDWFHLPLSDYKQCSKCGEQTGMNYMRCESLTSQVTMRGDVEELPRCAEQS